MIKYKFQKIKTPYASKSIKGEQYPRYHLDFCYKNKLIGTYNGAAVLRYNKKASQKKLKGETQKYPRRKPSQHRLSLKRSNDI